MKRFIASVIFFSFLIILFGQEISIKEEYISFPTYPFSDPDPVARPGKIYPYFRFDGYSADPVGQKHRMVVMENHWIKLWIAPDMGGKIWGALDKKTGKYFIYFNNVVKFREIAMRGPWTSGGIEFNFGSIGHAPTTATPVDYMMQKNEDGSVSCFLGAADLTSGTEWRVEVRLPADKAWFETNSYWNNPTNQKTSLYHWQTAAADGTDDLQYYFPGNAYIDHSGNAFDWPVMPDERDISLYSNNNYGTYHSYHVLGEYSDWFAGYFHKSETGFGHWSRYPYKPGKKIWIWGLSRQGEIWKNLLTDSSRGNTQYTEIQTGLLFNQEGDESTMSPFKHLYMMPGAVESFTERWFPISGTGGAASISQEGILNVEKMENGFKLVFQSLTYLKDTLQILDRSGRLFYESALNMEPEEKIEKEVNTDPDNSIIKIKGGELYYEPGNKKGTILERPLKTEPAFDWESVYGLYTRGIEKSRQRLYSEARIWLDKCISKDPSYLPAYTALGEIDFREMKYDNAEIRVLRVIGFDTYDPDANFLYGNLLFRKNEFNRARDAFGVTLRSTGYKSASLNQLALIALKEKRTDEAWEYISDALLYNGIDENILKTAVVISRIRNDISVYNTLIQKLSASDPLSHFAAFERYLTSGDSASLKKFVSGINTEFKAEVFISLALWYYKAGLDNNAMEVMKLSPAGPLGDLLTAWLASLMKDEKSSDFYLGRALSGDDKLVFPYRDEYSDILKWADKRRPGWKTKYYTALLLWSRGDTDKASVLFNECSDLPDSYSFYLSRGSFLKQTGGNEEPDYLKALQLGKNNWRPYHLLHGYYMAHYDFGKALEISAAAMKVFPSSYVIRTGHAQSLLNNGRFDECIRLLRNTEILPYEGAGYGRTIWRQANLLEAIRLIEAGKVNDAQIKIASAREWPENLGVGRPYTVDESYENILEAFCSYKRGINFQAEKFKSLISGLPVPDSKRLPARDPELLILSGINKLIESTGIKK